MTKSRVTQGRKKKLRGNPSKRRSRGGDRQKVRKMADHEELRYTLHKRRNTCPGAKEEYSGRNWGKKKGDAGGGVDPQAEKKPNPTGGSGLWEPGGKKEIRQRRRRGLRNKRQEGVVKRRGLHMERGVHVQGVAGNVQGTRTQIVGDMWWG